MKRALFLLALIVISAVPAFAQNSTQFGILIGGSRRFVKDGDAEPGQRFLDNDFSLSNGSIDLFWATELESDTYLKFKIGRIESPVAFKIVDESTDPDTVFRRDVEGQVQHAEANVEYRFSEPYGSTGLFGGLGVYRQVPDQRTDEVDTTTSWGFNAGVNADFPLSRRYGVIVEGTYHWSRAAFRPSYLTVGAGLRIGF